MSNATINYRVKTNTPRFWKSHPLAAGLVAAWSWPNCYGLDSIGGLKLSPYGTISYDSVLGLITNTASVSSGYQVNAPSYLQFTSSNMSYVWQGTQLTQSPSSGADIFGCTYNNANTYPTIAYAVGYFAGLGYYYYQYDNNNSYGAQYDNSGLVSNYKPIFLAGVRNSPNWYFYKNGISGASVTNSQSMVYGATPLIFFGDPSYRSNNSGVAHEYGLIYNRALSTGEIQALYTNGRDLFCKPHGIIGWTSALDQTYSNNIYSISSVSGIGISINGRIGNISSVSTIIGYSNNSGVASSLSVSNVSGVSNSIATGTGNVSSISNIKGIPIYIGIINSISVVSGAGHILNLNIVNKTDTISLSDSVTEVKWKPRSLSDNISFNDSISHQVIRVQNLVDTLDLDDTLVSRGHNLFNINLIDTLTFTAGNGYISVNVYSYVPFFTIPAGQTNITFKLVPSNVAGNRDISIITSPSLNYLYGSSGQGIIISRSMVNGLSPSNEGVGNILSKSLINGISTSSGIGNILSTSFVNGYSILWTGNILSRSFVNGVGS